MKLPQLKKLEDSIQALTDYFVTKYFGKGTEDVYWIADDIGGVLHVNDYFFSLSDIIEFLKYGYTTKQMFDYYDYRMILGDQDAPINIKNWRKLKG